MMGEAGKRQSEGIIAESGMGKVQQGRCGPVFV
jgi:hypothetical protein